MPPIATETRTAWKTLADPAELFLAWWSLASAWEPADRAILPEPLVATRNAMAAAVAIDDGPEAVAALLDLIDGDWPGSSTPSERRLGAGLVLQAMRAVDNAFTPLHPRTRTLAASFGAPPRLPRWVARAGRRRLRDGDFCKRETGRLIPNGPFSRHARGRDASSANSLQDQFPILTVAPTQSRLEDRTIEVHVKVVGTDTMRGVPASRSIGRERVRFIPLAEEVGDLSFITDAKGPQATLDVRPTVDTAARLIQALDGGGDIDLAFAPELTVPGSDEAGISAGIAMLASQAPRIILAGSGLSMELDDSGRSWNEARVFGRGGHLLWRHRKIWPFGMQRNSALDYGLTDPGLGETLMEDIAGSSTITVVDMDGFGRCLVLICQDFEGRPAVDEIIARYQPDWVLTPVLDPGVGISGWAHQRAVNLGSKSQARFLVGSSLTLSMMRKDAAEPAVGLAVGPAEPTVGPNGTSILKRAVALVHATGGSSPRSGALIWDHDPSKWHQSTVGSTH